MTADIMKVLIVVHERRKQRNAFCTLETSGGM